MPQFQHTRYTAPVSRPPPRLHNWGYEPIPFQSIDLSLKNGIMPTTVLGYLHLRQMLALYPKAPPWVYRPFSLARDLSYKPVWPAPQVHENQDQPYNQLSA